MSKAFSIYLDVVRFGAAFLVYLWHSNQRAIVEDRVPFSAYGHSAVIVFFVLSGFVIAFVTDTKERDLPGYASGRLARVYSVVVPTLLLTVMLDGMGRALRPDLYAWPFDHFAVRLLASLLMLNETWFISITSFSNAPYWSIAYECWYYILFGIMTFAPSRSRQWMLAAALLLLGPKIVLLLPVWASGVLLYRWQAPRQWSIPTGWILVVGSIAGIVAVHQSSCLGDLGEGVRALTGDWLYVQLTYSKNFLGDYLLGGLVWCNFAGMRIVAPQLARPLSAIERPVRAAAGLTFTLYLLHQPVLLFWASVINGDPKGWSGWWSVTALTALTILAIGHVTEHRRYALKLALEGRFRQMAGQSAGRA